MRPLQEERPRPAGVAPEVEGKTPSPQPQCRRSSTGDVEAAELSPRSSWDGDEAAALGRDFQCRRNGLLLTKMPAGTLMATEQPTPDQMVKGQADSLVRGQGSW